MHVAALDDVCNAAVIDLPVLIDRPRVLDLVVETETVFEVKMTESTPFQVTTTTDAALVMDLFQGGAFDVALTTNRVQRGDGDRRWRMRATTSSARPYGCGRR